MVGSVAESEAQPGWRNQDRMSRAGERNAVGSGTGNRPADCRISVQNDSHCDRLGPDEQDGDAGFVRRNGSGMAVTGDDLLGRPIDRSTIQKGGKPR